MKTLLYLCEQRALQIELKGSDWTIRSEYTATAEGLQNLSEWLQRQRWRSVSVLVDFAGVRWSLQNLPAMSLYNRLRYTWAQRREATNTSTWCRTTLQQPRKGCPRGSLAQLSFQESAGLAYWQPLLERFEHQVQAVYPALLAAELHLLPALQLAVGSEPTRHKMENEATLICARCADRHCWHLYYQNGYLLYVRVLPFTKEVGVLQQQIQQTLRYLQEENTGTSSSPHLQVTDDFAPDQQALQDGLDTHLVSQVSRVRLENDRSNVVSSLRAEYDVTTTQQRLFEQFSANPATMRQYRLSGSGRVCSQYRAMVRCLVSTRALFAFNLLLLLFMLLALLQVYVMTISLRENSQHAARLKLAQSGYPVPAQQMRDSVLLREHLLAGRLDSVSMLTHLAQAVSGFPGLVLERVEWLVDDNSVNDPVTLLDASLVAEPYGVIRVDEETLTKVFVRLTGYLAPDDASVNDSYRLYTDFRQALSSLPGVSLLAEHVPYDSASYNLASRSSGGNRVSGFSVLLGVENFHRED